MWKRNAENLPAWVASGRWGRRRVRVSECCTVVKAEHLHRRLKSSALTPAMGDIITANVAGDIIEAVFAPNRVWRPGRVFLICSTCSRRSTRLYRPDARADLRCRRCWGLTYESSACWSYHGPVGRLSNFSTTHAKRFSMKARAR